MSAIRLSAVGFVAALALGTTGSTAANPPPPRQVIAAHGVQARLFWATKRHWWQDHLRLEIWRHGVKRLDALIPPWSRVDNSPPQAYSPDHKPVAVRDLDGDGEPEVVLDLSWLGGQCCDWSRVYRFQSRSGRYAVTAHWWGKYGNSPKLQDLDRDGKPEFVSRDDRFGVIGFAGIAGQAFPLQIWSYRAGRFHDVTRRFPRELEVDAAWARGKILHPDGWIARMPAFIWAADEVRLGRADMAHAQLLRWADEGRFAGTATANGPYGRAFVAYLWRFLHRMGYLS